ncbi:hypothetical protein P3T76_000673 [Phytophthora citrophthora]|uniref:Transmembrane protein n=1 Tax=Phytophthora citrophthora TaxID=4793 RepID=A0AAD9LSZ3_9STRA|nr:hypothetical protein P3T76_000673 [Phytophthora citrophthora]
MRSPQARVQEVQEVFSRKVLAQRVFLMWIGLGLAPFILQARSYIKFVTPHKLSSILITPTDLEERTDDLHISCPVDGLFMASSWWNILPTHYHRIEDGRLCHFIAPQYNAHGNYFLGDKKARPYRTTSDSCANDSYPFEFYFYHGSIGYYSFYIEGHGTYCALDNTAYDVVRGVGTYDINGASVSSNKGDTIYRKSFWYGLTGSAWIAYRFWIIRRSFVSCKRFIRRCDPTTDRISFQDAMVFVQESLRLAAHGARNYHRVVLLFLLLDLGLMSDLFLLITQEGLTGRIQSISLGYNLAGIMSTMFEMVESMNWMRENTRCFVKRLLFNYETALVGELLTALLIQFYITSLNRSSLRHTEAEAKVASYYIMSLVGHGCIALGCVLVIVCTRLIGSVAFIRWRYGSLALLTTSCCVDTTLGSRAKLILLAGYVWEDSKLYYKVSTLKAFGILKLTEEDGSEFLVYSKLHWFSIPRNCLVVFGTALGPNVEPCEERPCSGVVSEFEQALGGDFGRKPPNNSSRSVSRQFKRVGTEPLHGPSFRPVYPAAAFPKPRGSSSGYMVNRVGPTAEQG